jgi:hypothetical protein
MKSAAISGVVSSVSELIPSVLASDVNVIDELAICFIL